MITKIIRKVAKALFFLYFKSSFFISVSSNYLSVWILTKPVPISFDKDSLILFGIEFILISKVICNLK